MSTLAGAPVIVLKEGTTRVRGRDARRSNILAAKVIGEAIKTTLGPKGMDKMLVDSLGDVVVTNDGATILDEIDVEHPAAKIMVELSKTQDNEAGDGTTTVVIIASELLSKAEELLDKNIHPIVIVNGFRKAAEKALETLSEVAIKVKSNDKDTLKRIAMTAMHGKSTATERAYLADLAVDAVLSVAEEREEKPFVDLDTIKIVKKQGKNLRESVLVRGVVLDKEVVHPGMPKRIKAAKIALLKSPLEVEKTEFDAEIDIRDPLQMKQFIEEETKMLRDMVEKIKDVGANVVFCQKGIDDMAQHFLAKHKILAVRRVSSKDMDRLAKATGARIITNVDNLSPEDLGHAGLVEERKIGEDKMVFIEECKNPRSITIVIRGGTEHVVDEAERAIHDALFVVKDVVEDGLALPGGGAVETEIALRTRKFAETIGGKEQLVVAAFADAIEVIPRTLAENSGFDPIEKMAALISKHKEGKVNAGIDVFSGDLVDMIEQGVIEPLRVKRQAIKSAVEAATMIMRIDDIIAAKGLEEKPGAEGKGEEEEESPGSFD